MGILQSFQIGVSGLGATGNGLTVIGDNIANAGTIGFKRSRAEFQDVLSTSLKGVDGGDQFGHGAKLSHIKPTYTQGSLTRTENSTDLALNGNGFFTVQAPFGTGFTRDGSFNFDKEGFLINGDGYKVMGYTATEDGKIANKIEPIKLGNTTVPAQATKEVEVSMNIDSRSKVLPFNILKPDDSSSFNTGMTVYDNVGTARLVTLYFNKASDNTWEYHACVDGKDAAGGKEGQMVEMASGKVIFNDKGNLLREEEGKNAFNFNQGAAPGQKIKFNFGKSITEGGTGIDASTQFGSESSVARHSQDGMSAATLASLSFNDDGVLTAVYNNGFSRNMSQIAVAKFENNEALFKMGKNLLKETRKSGQAIMGKPHQAGRGEVVAKSLELANVDLAQEFVDLITTQRNFQANAKTLRTADQMLEEVINIKRN
ncbi:MAG: flagellar hook protein [Bdellovibrionales bacterium RIFOXYB1_FULL_37_110]|nr:MAG: flagellar hook protein [Bdellovibrionales bacterium RIFOXYA1_FULL_38_20]OFZ48394.1 MAG: flagellar hook protein [Bdellovibrionales bacterium RIFOXYC1_FULL_37_79]OFZ58006.1 MAG: flagellar hook protein [Bdellovibrionales bacterium RIFOXYB1_FULL_37_110]OFZ63170.1 MAG: flagellar hook protein [Bdellovibrionales bacterium RIFOXYD1_FULL_36_51]